MILCVGAASRRVIEEAARLRVHQVVASRRQVGEFEPGYTGFDSAGFAETVRSLSDGYTNVVRDHGGPFQNGDQEDHWKAAFDADVEAGFDILHIDVCKLPDHRQADELRALCKRYAGKALIEVGGERDPQYWLDYLLEVALTECKVSTAVADVGGHVWADRQRGHLKPKEEVRKLISAYSRKGIVLKAHNLDWAGARTDYEDVAALYNVAPEFGNVEVDAWLHFLDYGTGQDLLQFAYCTHSWKRWFSDGEGTWFERARAALRYHLETPNVRAVLSRHDDTYVRTVIRDAILRG